jgi:PAS domain S-box-containing protein
LEKRYIRKDGEAIWVNLTVTLVRKPSGEPDYFISVIEEITARKRAEAALQASEERLRALINATPDIICFKDGEGRWLEANKADLELFELTDVDYHGKTDAELAEYTASRYREAFLECQYTDELAWQKGGLSRSEEVIPQPGGTRKVLDVIKVPIFEPDGRRKGLVVLGRDITARKRAEEALRESERKYRILVEQNQDGVFLIQDGRMQFVNSAFAEMVGYTVDEVVGMDFRDLVAPEDLEMVVDRYRRRQAGEDVSDNYEFRMLHKDGRSRVHINMSVGLVTYHGRVASLGTVKDITERRQMEEQLRKQEQLAAVGQLAAGVAHDFRNLLTSIILYAQMGERRESVSSELQQDLRIIIEASHKATELVQQLLDFSSHAMLERKSLELGAFVEDVLKIFRPAVPENIDVVYERGSDDYVVEVDPRRIQQALINLALNARDALLAQEGGELRFALKHLQIKPGESPPVADMPAGTWVRLEISDTGTGMTDEVLEHLFEPFFTTKAVGEGTGLGLAQVYGIVRQHEGYIDVETAVGVGTTFYIYLPTSTSETQPTVPPDVSMPSGEGETILLVEDEPELREASRNVLESLGYRVLIARNGQVVVDTWLSEPAFEDVALVITDLVMPEMGGRELLRVLHEEKPSLKVLAVTGYAVGEVMEDLRRLGFWEVLRKPFEMSSLAQVVRQALDSS